MNSSDVEKFRKGLLPHHEAVLSDGTTWLQRAITEHNLLAASRLYATVSLERLGRLLNVEAAQVRGGMGCAVWGMGYGYTGYEV